eukprot:CAMPEP_0177589674 /NCGR_PEP_ID=MMETSP0419_2-20121207/6948_1 /TAXON_ID=582737 /ORGANISM="Tetraselmis sp., Strain GSL018" /LENGTH=310 /DNA_ID=CAMNT_0019080081 /DNA_START=248 /DNA_END=1178 /DNA_ORIENTATION=-
MANGNTACSTGSLASSADRTSKKKLLCQKNLKKMNTEAERKGIVYISRVPPHMKPAKVRHLLSPFGEIGRLYLAPEDPAERKSRKKKGGNKGKEFTEGWVEFEDKRVAKRVAAILNGQPMDPKRRSAFHYDLWSLKYLPKFKWHHLTEDIAYQRAIREQKMAFEISNAKRERDFYLKQVGQSKAITAIEERRRKRAEAASEPGDEDAAQTAKRLRLFKQREAKPDPMNDDGAPMLSAATLGLIGGKGAAGGALSPENTTGGRDDVKAKKRNKKKSKAEAPVGAAGQIDAAAGRRPLRAAMSRMCVGTLKS